MSNSVKVGVIGVGSLGQWHAKVYATACPGAVLAGVCDADPDRAREIGARYHAPVFDSPAALADHVQAASIVVPTDQHAETAIPLIERGIHLLVEKPIAATLEESEAMIHAAARHQTILQVGHVERFNPVMSFLEEVLVQPRFVEAARLAPFPPPRPGLTPRGTEVSVVLDLMIHDLEVILHLVRSPLRELHACGVPVLSQSEDIANVRLLFENGCVANITASRVSQDRVRKIRVFQQDTYVSLDYQNQTGRLVRRENGAIIPAEVPIEKSDALERELTSFITCVRERHEPVVGGRHASDALKLAMDICRHIQAGGS
ncbi:MAG: Gfo/Idh/MocA family oxidoreductase [Kiritimatiellia bacterium]